MQRPTLSDAKKGSAIATERRRSSQTPLVRRAPCNPEQSTGAEQENMQFI